MNDRLKHLLQAKLHAEDCRKQKNSNRTPYGIMQRLRFGNSFLLRVRATLTA